jgi:hypothetical protein
VTGFLVPGKVVPVKMMNKIVTITRLFIKRLFWLDKIMVLPPYGEIDNTAYIIGNWT